MIKQNFIQSCLSAFYDLFFKKIGHKVSINPLKKFMDPFFVLIEKIVCHFPILISFYLKPYQSMVDQEISILSILPHPKVLVIGCGSLPATALALNNRYPSVIDCVDLDKKAVSNAKYVLSSLNKLDTISVYHKNGLNHSVNKYDIIFILYGIKDQKQILKYIAENSQTTTQILFRTSTDLKHAKPQVYSLMNSLFTTKNKVKIKSFGSIETYLLRLKE